MHQLLFLVFYLGLLPVVLASPFAGVMLYTWLDWLPPDEVYLNTLLPDFLSFLVGALAFVMWLFREKKTLPRPLTVLLIMAAYLIWINVTWHFALLPKYGEFHWDRTVKVIGFALLTAQMLSSRERLEAFVWTFVLAVIYYSVPSAIKVIVSGGSGGIGAGDVVTAGAGFFGDRVALSVVMSMALPFALYLGRQATLLPPRLRRWRRPAMLGVVMSLLISLIGTFARTAIFAGGAALLMIALRSRRKISAIIGVAVAIVLVLLIAPDNWFNRMNMISDYQQDASALSRLSAWKWAWEFALSHPIVGGGFGVFLLDAGHIYGRPGWLEAHNVFFEVMAEQGFVGLAIFILLIVATYRSCAVAQKRVRGIDDLAWAADLARAIQIALVAFVAGGMFISIASNPFLYILGGLAVGTRNIVERRLRESQRSPSLPALRAAAPAVSH
jgi:putative inorganic carbon (hco3(-)) transporter